MEIGRARRTLEALRPEHLRPGSICPDGVARERWGWRMVLKETGGSEGPGVYWCERRQRAVFVDAHPSIAGELLCSGCGEQSLDGHKFARAHQFLGEATRRDGQELLRVTCLYRERMRRSRITERRAVAKRTRDLSAAAGMDGRVEWWPNHKAVLELRGALNVSAAVAIALLSRRLVDPGDLLAVESARSKLAGLAFRKRLSAREAIAVLTAPASLSSGDGETRAQSGARASGEPIGEGPPES